MDKNRQANKQTKKITLYCIVNSSAFYKIDLLVLFSQKARLLRLQKEKGGKQMGVGGGATVRTNQEGK